MGCPKMVGPNNGRNKIRADKVEEEQALGTGTLLGIKINFMASVPRFWFLSKSKKTSR